MLGGEDTTYRLKLPSPFKKENLKVHVSPINIRYTHRKRTLEFVKGKISDFIKKNRLEITLFFHLHMHIWNYYGMK